MNIQEQIEALTQELRPYPVGEVFYSFDPFGTDSNYIAIHDPDPKWKIYNAASWQYAPFVSTNKAEVEEYADCYRRLKLYQLLGKKAEKAFPLFWSDVIHYKAFKVGTDFTKEPYHETGQVSIGARYRPCVLGGVWFAREEDRLNALKICGITKEMQEKCAKYGLGGA